MKTSKLLQAIPLSMLFICLLTACSDDENSPLSTIQETTFKGEASTLEISFTRNDWRIASVTDLEGYPTIGGTTQLEGLGTVYYGWATIRRDKENALTIETEDNFDGKERGFIINLEMKTGFYKEQIVIHQEPSENYYQIETIEYTVEEDDGVKEAETQRFKSTYKDENVGNTTIKWDFHPFINVITEYDFLFDDQSDKVFSWIDPKKRRITLPDYIEDEKVIMGEEELIFCAWGKYYRENELRYKSFEVDMVGMKWNVYSGTIFCKRLQVTFTLTLSRPGSDTKKVFKGKFRQKYPYDCSPVHHEVKDSLEQ